MLAVVELAAVAEKCALKLTVAVGELFPVVDVDAESDGIDAVAVAEPEPLPV